MKLISCNNCAVMLDADKLHFPDCIHEEGGTVDLDLGLWSSDKRDWVAYVKCPVCNEPIEEQS